MPSLGYRKPNSSIGFSTSQRPQILVSITLERIFYRVNWQETTAPTQKNWDRRGSSRLAPDDNTCVEVRATSVARLRTSVTGPRLLRGLTPPSSFAGGNASLVTTR